MPNIFTNPELVNPPSDVMLKIVKNHPGITMAEIHEMGYRLIWNAFDYLIDKDLVFYENERFYPNN